MASNDTIPIEMPGRHQQALEDPPEFSDEQLTYLEAVLAVECCHMTGMHDPSHWVEGGTVCWDSMVEPFRRALRELGLEVPVYSARDCGKCRNDDWHGGKPSPFEEEYPTYSVEADDGE